MKHHRKDYSLDITGNITVETSQENITVETSQEKIKVETSHEKITVETSQEKIMVETSQEKIIVETSQEHFIVETSQEHFIVETSQQRLQLRLEVKTAIVYELTNGFDSFCPIYNYSTSQYLRKTVRFDKPCNL